MKSSWADGEPEKLSRRWKRAGREISSVSCDYGACNHCGPILEAAIIECAVAYGPHLRRLNTSIQQDIRRTDWLMVPYIWEYVASSSVDRLSSSKTLFQRASLPSVPSRASRSSSIISVVCLHLLRPPVVVRCPMILRISSFVGGSSTVLGTTRGLYISFLGVSNAHSSNPWFTGEWSGPGGFRLNDHHTY